MGFKEYICQNFKKKIMMKSIKTLVFTLALFLVSATIFAQSKTPWKEQQDFHSVMSTTFHPVEEGNFTPIKTRSAEMVEKAKTWKNSQIPADIKDKKAVKKSLKELVAGSKKLDKSIHNGATDAEIKTQLTELHEVFHTIVGLCNAKGETHEEHEKH